MAQFVTTTPGSTWDFKIIPEDHERYEQMGRAFSRKLFGAYVEAGKNPYDYSLMVDDPYHPYISPSPLPPMMQGWRWPKFETPLRDGLKRKAGRQRDFVNTSFETFGVSEKVIDIIESIEPGIHQYLPYELLQPDGSVHPDRRWLLNVSTRAFTIDHDRSNVIPMRDHPHWIMDRTNVFDIALRKEAVAGRAIWFEARYKGGPGFGLHSLLSDRCWHAFMEAGITGLQRINGNYGRPIPEL